jgi:hypothetical protein
MTSRISILLKSLHQFVLLRTLILTIAFVLGFNLVVLPGAISVPSETRKLFMHNWGYFILTYAGLLYTITILLFLLKKMPTISFKGTLWITLFYTLVLALFLGKSGLTGILIGVISYGIFMALLYLFENTWPILMAHVFSLFKLPAMQRVTLYTQSKPSAPFILSFVALLVVSSLLIIIKFERAAELVADVAYFLLVFGIGIEVYQYLKIPTDGNHQDMNMHERKEAE